MFPVLLIPLLVSAGILLAGNGLLGTLVAVRAGLEGFPEALIGLMGTSYFIGYMGGCLITATLIRRAGHIRVFAALAALNAIAVLTMVMLQIPWVWILARALTGLGFCGIAMVIESWLNEVAEHSNRGRILSVYRIVDLSSVTGGQFLLPLVGVASFEVFGVTAMLFCLALLPVSLSTLDSPAPPDNTRLKLKDIWILSPVACAGVVTIGLTNGAFRTVGPLYAQRMGLDVEQVALFMSLGIFAGAVSQYPLGWLSDRIGRRSVLMMTTLGAAAAGAFLATTSVELIYLGGFLFGAFAMPLYSLSMAHANDYAKPGQYLALSGGLILFFCFGASVGPLIVSVLMEHFGPGAFFAYASTLHISFVVFVAYRVTRRAAVPRALRTRFVGILRTSPMMAQLARKDN